MVSKSDRDDSRDEREEDRTSHVEEDTVGLEFDHSHVQSWI